MIEVREFNELLRKIKYDAEARQVFCLEYFSRLKTYVRYKYGNYSDWEDIVQDVIKKLIDTDWTNYPYIKNPIGWLHKVTDNHAKDVFKKSNKVCELKKDSYSDFDIEHVEMQSDLREAMRHLSHDLQYILYAHYWLGKELYTIAEEMGKSYVSVRVTAHRARKLLEKYL